MATEGTPVHSSNADYSFEGWRPQVTKESMMARRGKVPRYDGCSMKDWQKRHDAKPLDMQMVLSTRISPAEVQAHSDMDDLWMVIDGVVFDLTTFQMYHPGGEHILRACAGKDATDVFQAFHRWVSCENMIGRCAVGLLADVSPSDVDPGK